MRKLSLLILILVAAGSTTLADTLHLKNGSVIKGKVTSFVDDQFIVMLDTGSGRLLSKATIYIGDVAKIDFDSSSGVADGGEISTPTNTPSTVRESNPTESSISRISQSENPRSGSDAPTSTETSSERPIVPASTEPAPGTRAAKKPAVPVLTATIDVMAKKDWTSTGLIVRRGDRINITASGNVTLDPSSSALSGPDGTEIADAKKLMPDKPTGALIAVISSDNDDFLFVGRAAEFVASRDGLLFLSVNEGNLADNSGAYKATIEVAQSGRSKP